MWKKFEISKSSYGGTLLKKREARSMRRPLDTHNTMHLVVRSSQARGNWSFLKKANKAKISTIVTKFSQKYSVKIHSMANVGNHLHFHIKLSDRSTYKKFINALTSAIVMAVTGASRVKKLAKHFWDYRPFTRIVFGYREFMTLQNYILINQLEGLGYYRFEAIEIIRRDRERGL